MNQARSSGVAGARIQSQARSPRLRLAVVTALVVAVLASACGDSSGAETIVIGGIPDQDLSVLEERFGGIADYLSDELGIPVEYQPSTDYAALVTAFSNGDVLLGWFGGLTGVQARLATDGAHAIAQRPIDERFRSVFVARADLGVESLEDLAGLSFTFGSESSTSGHLMPRYFLQEAGIDPESDFDGPPGYSGSHDVTWQLVESGAYQAGALNATVWQRAVDEGRVDTDRVAVVLTTPEYYDYHWVAHPDLDQRYGDGTVAAVQDALLAMGADEQEILDLFDTDRFIRTFDANYDAIEAVARSLDLLPEG